MLFQAGEWSLSTARLAKRPIFSQPRARGPTPAEFRLFKWAFGNLAVMVVDIPLTRLCMVTSMARFLRWIPRRSKNVDQAFPNVEKLWMSLFLVC